MIPFLRPNKPNLEVFSNFLKDSVEKNHYTNFGPNHNKLKSKFQELTGVQDVVLACNATVILDGLHTLLAWHDLAYLPSFTFPATNQGCQTIPKYSETIIEGEHIGKPVWDTIHDSNTGTEAYAVTVNPFGSLSKPCDRPADVGYWIVDNAAGLLTQTESWLDAGADAVVYSLHATKILSACEGGVVFFSSSVAGQKLYAEYSKYINFGIKVNAGGYRSIGIEGSNHKMSELSAAWCLMNLETYLEDVAGRLVTLSTYCNFCKASNVTYIPSVQAFWILGKVSNLEIQDKAKEYEVEVRPYYEKLSMYEPQSKSNTNLFNSNGFCIPSYSIDYMYPVVDMLKKLKELDFI